MEPALNAKGSSWKRHQAEAGSTARSVPAPFHADGPAPLQSGGLGWIFFHPPDNQMLLGMTPGENLSGTLSEWSMCPLMRGSTTNFLKSDTMESTSPTSPQKKPHSTAFAWYMTVEQTFWNFWEPSPEVSGPSRPIPSFRCKWEWRFKHFRKKSRERQNGLKWWALSQDLGALSSCSGPSDLCNLWLGFSSKADSPSEDVLRRNASFQGEERPWSLGHTEVLLSFLSLGLVYKTWSLSWPL